MVEELFYFQCYHETVRSGTHAYIFCVTLELESKCSEQIMACIIPVIEVQTEPVQRSSENQSRGFLVTEKLETALFA
jgi:hypothetical protein